MAEMSDAELPTVVIAPADEDAPFTGANATVHCTFCVEIIKAQGTGVCRASLET